MNLTLSNSGPDAEDLALLRATTRDAVAALFGRTPDERWPNAWTSSWQQLDALGLWSAIDPPEGSMAAAVTVVEELGRALYPGPAVEALAARYVLAALGDPPSAATDVAAAVLRTAKTVPAAGASTYTTLDPAVGEGPDMVLLVAAGGRLYRAPAYATETIDTPIPLDVTRNISTVRLPDPQLILVSDAASLVVRQARAAMALLYCADTLGCVEHALARTIEYAQQRTTFGAPIGKYQAVAHRLVDHTITVAQMRLLLEDSAEAFDRQVEGLTRRAAICLTYFAARGAAIVSDCIQLAGAIGFTWEFGHHFYLRRVVATTAVACAGQRPQRALASEQPW